jgi:hypothetical protein
MGPCRVPVGTWPRALPWLRSGYAQRDVADAFGVSTAWLCKRIAAHEKATGEHVPRRSLPGLPPIDPSGPAPAPRARLIDVPADWASTASERDRTIIDLVAAGRPWREIEAVAGCSHHVIGYACFRFERATGVVLPHRFHGRVMPPRKPRHGRDCECRPCVRAREIDREILELRRREGRAA